MQCKIKNESKDDLENKYDERADNHSCNEMERVTAGAVKETDGIEYQTAAKKHAVMRVAAKQDFDDVVDKTAEADEEERFEE